MVPGSLINFSSWVKPDFQEISDVKREPILTQLFLDFSAVLFLAVLFLPALQLLGSGGGAG